MLILCTHQCELVLLSFPVPEIKWVMTDSEVSILEGEDMLFCFSNDIASAVPYQVEVGVHLKGNTAASGKSITKL